MLVVLPITRFLYGGSKIISAHRSLFRCLREIVLTNFQIVEAYLLYERFIDLY